MWSDQELLELAAKAYGLEGYVYVAPTPLDHGHMQKRNLCEEGFELQVLTFDPLNEPGDALRLAVKLGLDIVQFEYNVSVWAGSFGDCDEDYGTSPLAATCRAITRAAAEVGATL